MNQNNPIELFRQQCELGESCGTRYFYQVWTSATEDTPQNRMASLFPKRTMELSDVLTAVERASQLPIWGVRIAAYESDDSHSGPILDGYYHLENLSNNQIEWQEVLQGAIPEVQWANSGGKSVRMNGMGQAPSQVHNYVSVEEQIAAAERHVESKMQAQIEMLQLKNRIKELEKEVGQLQESLQTKTELVQRFRSLGIQYKRSYEAMQDDATTNKNSLGSTLGNPAVLMEWVQLLTMVMPIAQGFMNMNKKGDATTMTPTFTPPAPMPMTMPTPTPTPNRPMAGIQEEDDDDDEDVDDSSVEWLDEDEETDDEFDIEPNKNQHESTEFEAGEN